MPDKQGALFGKGLFPGALTQGSSWSHQAATLFREGKWSLAMQELERNGGDLHREWTP